MKPPPVMTFHSGEAMGAAVGGFSFDIIATIGSGGGVRMGGGGGGGGVKF